MKTTEELLKLKNLPKLNKRKHESIIKQNELSCKLFRFIEQFEKENNYKFESYEIDNVLLNIIKNNHEYYIRAKFGNDLI